MLRELTVTATAAPRRVVASAPTHSLSSADMARVGVTDISDALHRLPGVTLRDYGGAGGLKTVSVRGMGSGHTAVIYDGLPLSDVQSGQIDVSRYSLDNVERLSLIVGDNDDIFKPARTSASAASLTIATAADADSLLLKVQLRGGSFGLVNPFYRIGVPVGRVYVSSSGEFTHARNDYPFTLRNVETVTRERRHNSMMNSGHAELGATWHIDPSNTLSAKAYYYDNDRELPGPVVYYNTDCRERLHERNAFGQLNFRGAPDERWLIQASAKFNFASSLYSDRNGKYPGGELHQDYFQREAYATASVLYMPTDRWSASYAADWFYNNLNSNLKSDRRPWRHSLLQALSGRYRSRRFTAMGRLLLSVYRNGAERGEAAADALRLSPSVSLSAKPLAQTNLYVRASFKDIFRMPTFNEAYFDHFGSQDLKPENTRQCNLGLTWSAPTRGPLAELTATADGYVNLITAMIVAVPYNMFVWRVVNLSKVRVFGLDATLSATVRPARNQAITLSGNYSLQRAQPRTDPTSSEWNKQVAYTPLHSGSLAIGWENPWVNLSLHGTAVSERFTTNNNLPSTRVAGYVELGATASHTFRFRGHRIDLRLDLINALDAQYCVVAFYPMPGRSWQATVAYTFGK